MQPMSAIRILLIALCLSTALGVDDTCPFETAICNNITIQTPPQRHIEHQLEAKKIACLKASMHIGALRENATDPIDRAQLQQRLDQLQLTIVCSEFNLKRVEVAKALYRNDTQGAENDEKELELMKTKTPVLVHILEVDTQLTRRGLTEKERDHWWYISAASNVLLGTIEINEKQAQVTTLTDKFDASCSGSATNTVNCTAIKMLLVGEQTEVKWLSSSQEILQSIAADRGVIVNPASTTAQIDAARQDITARLAVNGYYHQLQHCLNLLHIWQLQSRQPGSDPGPSPTTGCMNSTNGVSAYSGGSGVGTMNAAEPVEQRVPPAPQPTNVYNVQTLDLWPPGYVSRDGTGPAGAEGMSPSGFLQNISVPRLIVHLPPLNRAPSSGSGAAPIGAGVLVLSGGGYVQVEVGNEGDEVVSWLLTRGVVAFELVYRLPGEGWNSPDVVFADAKRAMRLIRYWAAQGRWNGLVDPRRVGAVGFSSGGHLAATLGLDVDRDGWYTPIDDADLRSAKPDYLGLMYSVLSLLPPVDANRVRYTLAGSSDPRTNSSLLPILRRWSPASFVTPIFPATFIAQAMDDPLVPIDSSLRMFDALRSWNGSNVELHLFQSGGHGWGTGALTSPTHAWTGLFETWCIAPRNGFWPDPRVTPPMKEALAPASDYPSNS